MVLLFLCKAAIPLCSPKKFTKTSSSKCKHRKWFVNFARTKDPLWQVTFSNVMMQSRCVDKKTNSSFLLCISGHATTRSYSTCSWEISVWFMSTATRSWQPKCSKVKERFPLFYFVHHCCQAWSSGLQVLRCYSLLWDYWCPSSDHLLDDRTPFSFIKLSETEMSKRVIV